MQEGSMMFPEKEVQSLFRNAEKQLLKKSKRIQFKKCKTWRGEFVPDGPGVYTIFDETGTMLYVGESANVRARMNDITRTVNHSFRRQLGKRKFEGVIEKSKFVADVELMLDNYFSNNLYVSFLEVNYGRCEIESYLINKYRPSLYNSIRKRK